MNNTEALKKCPLFKGVPEYSITAVMGCLRARERHYGKNEYVYNTGDPIKEIGIVLSGRLQIIKEDAWGSVTIVAELTEGMLFGEAFVLGGVGRIPLSVFAPEKSDVLFIDKDRTVTPCPSACGFHFDISANLIRILAEKNIFLTGRVEHLSKRSIKEKVLSYLSSVSSRTGSRTFFIPFDRRELADYLAVDRSALSSVLGKLKNEGIIDFNKNKFTLK